MDSTLIEGEFETPPFEEGINSSQDTVSSSLDVQMPILSNKLNKLDIPIVRYELVPDELTLTHEDENPSWIPVEPAFNNDLSVVVSSDAEQLDTSSTAEEFGPGELALAHEDGNPSWIPVEPEFNNDRSIVLSNDAEKLDTPSTAEELGPGGLTLTQEGETENSSRVSVEPEFNNDRSAAVSDDAEKLDTLLAAEEFLHDVVKEKCQEQGVVILKTELHAKAKKVCLIYMQEGGSKAGPFEKLAIYFESPGRARTGKKLLDKSLKATAVFAPATKKKRGTMCIEK